MMMIIIIIIMRRFIEATVGVLYDVHITRKRGLA